MKLKEKAVNKSVQTGTRGKRPDAPVGQLTDSNINVGNITRIATKRTKRRSARRNTARYLFALEQSYPKYIPKNAVGGCAVVAEKIARDMINKGMTLYKVYEGFVHFSNGKCHIHTWMEYANTKYDPTLQQFKSYGDDYNLTTVEYEIRWSFSPKSYLKIFNIHPFSDEYIQHVMNDELKTDTYKIIDGKEVYDLKHKPLFCHI